MSDLILAIETSGSRFSVALCRDGHAFAHFYALGEQQHESGLAPAISQLLVENKVTISNLAAIAVGSGPGSYSGLRMGMALASGFSLAAQIPLIPIGTLENMNYQIQTRHPEADYSMILLKARHQESFLGIWAKNREEAVCFPQWMHNEKVLLTLRALPDFRLLVMNSQNILKDELFFTGGEVIEELVSPDAATVGQLAHKMLPEFLNSGYQNEAEPNYLKPVYITPSRHD